MNSSFSIRRALLTEREAAMEFCRGLDSSPQFNGLRCLQHKSKLRRGKCVGVLRVAPVTRMSWAAYQCRVGHGMHADSNIGTCHARSDLERQFGQTAARSSPDLAQGQRA